MNQTVLSQTLTEMREKYLDKRSVCDMAQGHERTRKMMKIKKKMVMLEKERCHKLLDHQDVTLIDTKIKELKDLYGKCCQHQ